MILSFRPILLATSIVALLIGAYYFIERDQARVEQDQARQATIESINAGRAALQDMRKKLRDAPRQTVEESCARLREDFDVWDDYLDKKSRRKLKGLIDKCDHAGEAEAVPSRKGRQR
jgi:cell division protein FtsB